MIAGVRSTKQSAFIRSRGKCNLYEQEERELGLRIGEVIILKYIKQFSVILAVSFAGEALKHFLPLPIPSSIYGLLLMLAALCLKIIPLEAVRDTGRFLVEIMPLMFIPAAVGLTQSWNRIQPILLELIVVVVVSTILVMAVSGRVTQAVMRLEEKKKRGKDR